MRPVEQIVDESGRVWYPTLEKEALHLDRKGRLSQEDLDRMRHELAALPFKVSVESQANLLQYANRLLTDAERSLEHYYDLATAEVQVNSVTLVFMRAVDR
jgi:hypothetical protein